MGGRSGRKVGRRQAWRGGWLRVVLGVALLVIWGALAWRGWAGTGLLLVPIGLGTVLLTLDRWPAAPAGDVDGGIGSGLGTPNHDEGVDGSDGGG